jgi:cytochrome b subunit of formate dehydrogenase
MTENMSKQTETKRQPKIMKRYIRRRDALNAAQRLRARPDGSRYVIRFNPGQRAEHLILLISFTVLGMTGLAQTYYDTAIGAFILNALGGITGTREVHHVAAFVFGAQSIYHTIVFLNDIFVYRHVSRMFPEWKDVADVIDMLKLNLGLTNKHPRFDRYNFEEKAEYWALVWGTVVMGITGVMQWFPVQVTSILPGWMIPVARAFHRWEAILAVLAIATWHSYHAVIKKYNNSIFDGIMSYEDMQEEHPLELIYLEKAAATLDANMWPALIEIPLEEEEPEAVVEETSAAGEREQA